jgi:hypothetical protein
MINKALIFDKLASIERNKLLKKYDKDEQSALDHSDSVVIYHHELGEKVGNYRQTLTLQHTVGIYNFIFTYAYMVGDYKIKVYNFIWSVN